jgi:hypothetical protein
MTEVISSHHISEQESWDIQCLAARNLEAGHFNFQAAMDCLLAHTPISQDTTSMIIQPETGNPEQKFHLLLELFLEDRLTQQSQQLFLAALQAGIAC